jgi:serralysin
MATVSDLNNTSLSGLNHIDALLDVGPDWNYFTPVGNTLFYTFSITSGNEKNRTGQEAFTLAQQNWVRTALNELQAITGVKFAETTSGDAAQLHFCNLDIPDSASTAGLCSWQASFSYTTGNQLVSYDADAYIYLDNREWYAQNRDLAPGGWGYETLLHELGHAMGLKHPFDDAIHLQAAQDNTANTLMSYTNAGGPHMHYSQYDIAALNWIYGADGLRGALGLNAATGARYITGTSGADTLTGTAFDDTLEGDAGNDTINGGDGIDTVVYRGERSSYNISQIDGATLIVSGGSLDGTDTLASVEILKFSDGSYQRAQLAGLPPPTFTLSRNANGFVAGSIPFVTGAAEAGSTVSFYSGTKLVGSTQVDSTGIFTLALDPFIDGNGYSIYATATDAAGRTSAPSESVTFNVDSHAPPVPTGHFLLAEGGNQLIFDGGADGLTIIQLVNVNNATEIGRTAANSGGGWHIDSAPLPNGEYSVAVVSLDAADNATSSADRMVFTINSKLNFTGDAGANSFAPGEGNNAIDGKNGIDKAVYNAPRADFKVSKDVYGYAVVDTKGANGHDTLVSVERIQFSDNKWLALDIDGSAGQVYRLYQAAFDRTPDAGGYSFWLDAMDKGFTLKQISEYVLANKEAVDLYMVDPSNQYFITQLYHHVLHREPEGSGYQWWLGNMEKATRAEVLAMFSESPENQAQVIGSIQNGIEFTPQGG